MVALPSTAVLQNFVLPGNFTNLNSVVFSPVVNTNQGSTNYEFTLDNIVINGAAAVPEPSTLAGLTLGVVGAIGYRSRRRSVR